MLTYKKFNLTEALNNSRGKSSLGLLFGLLYGVAALVLYGIGVYCLFNGANGYNDLFTQGAILTGASGTLIGVRRFTKDKELNIEETNGNNNSEPGS
jgi:hypothetical protein